jgi:hypothetical protein
MSDISSTIAAEPSLESQARGLRGKLVLFLVLVLATIAACFFIEPPAKMSEPGVWMHWPDQVLGYTGQEIKLKSSDPERVLLPSDTEIAKELYTNQDGDHIAAEIVLSGVEHRSIHRPEICLKGQGWTLHSGQVVRIPLELGRRSLEVTVLDITQPLQTPQGKVIQQEALYAYFFVSKDAETAKHFDRIAITNLDLLLHNKSHRWAYVIAMAGVNGGRTREQTLDIIKRFFQQTAPSILRSESPNGPPDDSPTAK